MSFKDRNRHACLFELELTSFLILNYWCRIRS